MIFGNKQFRESFMGDVHKIEKEQGIKVIYGNLIGSIPQGIQCYDSDYDTVFLYIKNNFPNEIIDADEADYPDILYRYYPEDPLSVYDSLTYRELTSFFHLLLNPSIHHENRDYGLYYYFLDVLLGPYAWDPYGIQNKIMPYITACYNHEFLVRGYINKINILHRNSLTDKEGVFNYKFYIRKVLYAFFLEWVLNNKTFAPTYMESVLLSSPSQVAAEALRRMLDDYRQQDILSYSNTKVTSIKEAHVGLKTQPNPILEEFVRRELSEGEKWLSSVEGKNYFIDRNEVKKSILQIIKIVNMSLNEERVKGVWE